MMHQEPGFNQPSWPFYNVINSSFDQIEFDRLDMDIQFSGSDLSSSLTICDEFFVPSHEFPPSHEVDCVTPWPKEQEVMLPVEDFYDVFSDSQDFLSDVEFVGSSCSSIRSSIDSSLILPMEEIELDIDLAVFHLLKAYGEAMETGHRNLAEVIKKFINQKVVSPGGKILERLAFYLFHESNKEREYLVQESYKNFEAAFRVFYQVFPHGRFAHFAANSSILESIPADAESILIVDFDIGEGIQWPPVIEALARQHRPVRLTAVKWKYQNSTWIPLIWNFDETKRRLVDYARSHRLALSMDEIELEDLIAAQLNCRKQYLVLNCMVGLPHMGRLRNKALIKKFLMAAKNQLMSSNGIITLANGDKKSWRNFRSSSSFGLFFNDQIEHYKALLESIHSQFPIHLAEASLAMECLFIAPYANSHSWLENWMEGREDYDFHGLRGLRVSDKILEEAIEIVKGKESSYGARLGEFENEMVLEWKGTSLVSLSSWRSYWTA